MSDHHPASNAVSLKDVRLSYGKTLALAGVTLDIPAGRMVGLIGPDGAGKSSLLSLIAGARKIQIGDVEVLSGDMRNSRHRQDICPVVAYMQQGLGRNLSPTLSVFENVDFFARLFGLGQQERRERITKLLARTGLSDFRDWPVGKLSSGLKQKLGLCCALVHDPALLILDEPTTGLDPLSRRRFWHLVDDIRAGQPQMSVIVATAAMEEASRFDWLVAMDGGKVLATGSPAEIFEQTGAPTLDDAFIAMLPPERRAAHRPVEIAARPAAADDDIAIEADGLTMRFGDVTAVDHASFRIARGEIFGLLGSNGGGKSTTMKMLAGLLPASEGAATLFGKEIGAGDISMRRRVGYMLEAFALHAELTVRQNLDLQARLYHLPPPTIPARIEEMANRFDLGGVMHIMPDALSLGIRQRLSLAMTLIHTPKVLILDEPTSGMDPIARDQLWQTLGDLSRNDDVTILISTHFMNEAERCDRISLMHDGKVLITDTPDNIRNSRNAATLEEAIVAHLEDASGETTVAAPVQELAPGVQKAKRPVSFDLGRMLSYTRRETLELRRDPIRMALALIGSLLLMVAISYGINFEVKNLPFAVLDGDDTTVSRNYISEFAGSGYFIEQPPLRDGADLDQRMREGSLSVAIEIPRGFAQDVARGQNAEIRAWIDGAMPQRAETIRGTVQGIHSKWRADTARELQGNAAPGHFSIETRFRYNPSMASLVAIVPTVIPLLLLLIPAMLAALSIVREKELGSIVNLYVTPVTKLEFLVGKQLPYIGLAMVNAILLWLVATQMLKVPFTGDLIAFLSAALLYVWLATAFGLFISSFTSSQFAVIFGTAALTILPALQFSGMIDPVSALEGAGSLIGQIYPTTYFNIIARGTFSKGLDLDTLRNAFLPLLVAAPLLLIVSTLFLKKQAR